MFIPKGKGGCGRSAIRLSHLTIIFQVGLLCRRKAFYSILIVLMATFAEDNKQAHRPAQHLSTDRVLSPDQSPSTSVSKFLQEWTSGLLPVWNTMFFMLWKPMTSSLQSKLSAKLSCLPFLPLVLHTMHLNDPQWFYPVITDAAIR